MERNVRRHRLAGRRKCHSHHSPADNVRNYSADARRLAAEGLRIGLWNQSLHCHQHLRHHPLEVVQSTAAAHRIRKIRVRGRHCEPGLPALRLPRQSVRLATGLLPRLPNQPQQPDCHGARLPRSHLLPRIQSRPPNQEPASARGPAILPDKALLHLQHANHSADRPGFQSLLHFPAALQEIPRQHAGEDARTVAGVRGRRTLGARRRTRLSNFPAPPLRGVVHQSSARPLLHSLRPRNLRPFLEDLDRSVGLGPKGRA